MVATRLACASSICISWNRRSLSRASTSAASARLRRGSHGPEGQPDEPEAAHAGEHCGAQLRTWAAAASAAMAPANAPAVARISSMMALPRPVATTASALPRRRSGEGRWFAPAPPTSRRRASAGAPGWPTALRTVPRPWRPTRPADVQARPGRAGGSLRRRSGDSHVGPSRHP